MASVKDVLAKIRQAGQTVNRTFIQPAGRFGQGLADSAAVQLSQGYIQRQQAEIDRNTAEANAAIKRKLATASPAMKARLRQLNTMAAPDANTEAYGDMGIVKDPRQFVQDAFTTASLLAPAAKVPIAGKLGATALSRFATASAVRGAEGAGYQGVSNLIQGRPVGENVGKAALGAVAVNAVLSPRLTGAAGKQVLKTGQVIDPVSGAATRRGFVQLPGGEGNPIRQTPLQSQPLKELARQTKPVPSTIPQEFPLNSTFDNSIPQGAKERKLVTSIREASGVTKPTKELTSSTYIPKQNNQLMGEAKALLSEGASIDFKNTKNVDQKVTAAVQEAINMDKAGNHDAAANLFNNLSEHGTELGRGVQAFSLLDKMSPEAISLSTAGRIKKYNQTARVKIPELNGDQQKIISDSVNAIRNMAEGREKNIAINELGNMLSDFVPSSLSNKAITVWKAGLLTSLRTHERNLLGNTIMSAAEIVKDPFATIADTAMSGVTGKRTMSTTLSGLREFGSATTRQQIKDLVTKGYDPSNEVSKFDVQRVTWANTPTQQALKKFTNAVFRPLGAEDKAFYNAAYSRSLYDQAGAEAINAGRKGDSAFINSLVKKPNENMLATATADANYATFHDKNALSGAASSIKNFIKKQPGIVGDLGGAATDIVAPFTGVPSSIVGKTVAYSPIGLIKGAVNVGRVITGQVPELQRQAAQEVGRGVVGSGLFGLGAYLMNKGLMTGQPKDAKEADLWAAQNKQANSVLINGKWRSINSIGPQSLVVLAGAKYNEEMNKEDGSFGAYAGGLGKDQLSQTFLAGVQGPLNAITDPARYGKSYIGNQASSIVPNIFKDTAKAFDTSQRENNNVGDYITNSIPGLRNRNLPKRSVLGDVLPQEPTGINAFVDLFNSKTASKDPVANELARLYSTGNSSAPSKLTTSQTILGQKVKLTPQELDQLEQQTGAPIKTLFTNLMNTDEYKKASDEEKSKSLGKIVDNVRTQGKITFASGGTGGVVNIDKTSKDAQLALAKDSFDKSGKNYQVVGDTVLRRSASGDITATPKYKFDYQLGTAELAKYKNANNLKGWLETANKQVDLIDQQLQDPSIDPLEAITLQNDAQGLLENIEKYSGYGGFKKGKKAKKISISVPKGAAVKKPGVVQAPAARKGGRARKVSAIIRKPTVKKPTGKI